MARRDFPVYGTDALAARGKVPVVGLGHGNPDHGKRRRAATVVERGHRLVVKTQPLGQPAQVVGLLDGVQLDGHERGGVNIGGDGWRVDRLDQGRNIERVLDFGGEEFRVRRTVHDARPLVVVKSAVGTGGGDHGAQEQPGVRLAARCRAAVQGLSHHAAFGRRLLLAPAAAEFGFTVMRPDALGDQIVENRL
jgi:hypothetical protein